MKYKEFLIDKLTNLSKEIENNILVSDPRRQLFHVIEYQAYEKLQKENERLKDIATRASRQGCNPVNQYDCLACDAKKILKEIEGEK